MSREKKKPSVFPRNLRTKLVWYFKWKNKAFKLGDCDKVTREQAEAMRDEIHAKLVKEANPTWDDWLIQDLCDYYLDHACYMIKPKSKQNKERVLDLFCEKFGKLKYRELQQDEVHKWIYEAKNWNASGKFHAAVTIKGVGRYFFTKNKVTKHPLNGLYFPEGEPRGEEYAITEEEVKLIRDKAEDWLRDVLDFMYWTGCRPDEALSLTRDEYRPHLNLVSKKTHKCSHKNMKRDILLSSQAKEIVERLSNKYPQGRLFRGKEGGNYTVSRLGDYLKKTAKKAGISKERIKFIIPYSYRHRWCISMLEAGIAPSDLASLMGHKGTRMIEHHYGHALDRVQYKGNLLNKLEQYRSSGNI